MKLFGTKTILKTCLNTRETLKIFLSKVLSKHPKRWGIYSPIRKLAVRLSCQPDRLTVDRPVNRQRSKIWPLEQPDRPPGRPPRYREQGSLFRSTGRSTGPVSARRAQNCARRSTARVDRPLVRSTVRSTDLACQPQSGSETGSEKHVKHISKNLLSLCKNTQK